MWVEELNLENIRCFENETIKLTKNKEKCNWITFLGENGSGKSTALQALGLLLAGPEGAINLLTRPSGWVRNEKVPGKIGTRIHQGENDPGKFGREKVRKAFKYSYHFTGNKPLKIRNKEYKEPTIVPDLQKTLSWLRNNAFISQKPGWFAAGYGSFRRMTRSREIIVPSLAPDLRHLYFTTQFNEDEPMAAFERWMVYLDYHIAKRGKGHADSKRVMKLGIQAINEILPEGVKFDSVSAEGRIFFRVGKEKVPTISLSDGYRSILALAGDLVWRLITSFPGSNNPLHEEGVVLIDELDIHLHPTWQRDIAGWLMEQFPNMQFIVATHSPLIAAGAGPESLTFKFQVQNGFADHELIQNLSYKDINDILQSNAFRLVSTFSPGTQEKIDRYDELLEKNNRSKEEDSEYEDLVELMSQVRPFAQQSTPGSLESLTWIRNCHDQSNTRAKTKNFD